MASLKYLFIILLLFTAINYSQQSKTVIPKPVKDSLSTAVKDSSSVSDSLKNKKGSDVDAIIFASSADSLIFNIKQKKMSLYGSSELKYKKADLKSSQIYIDYKTNTLEAIGTADTSDTAKAKMKGLPVLTDGGETFEGNYIKYNFKTERGYISLAKNKEKEQRYEGQRVKKVDKETFFIEDGMFTTCDSDTPHTHFTASSMKVIQQDKVIARWIFMHIGGVPIPIPLPFAVFPNEKGRRSGLIIPTYGQSADRGAYFYNFGYFWAMNDYMDIAFNGDYYTKGGYGLRSSYRYNKRYDFSGNLNVGYSKIIRGESSDPDRSESTDWNLSWYHNQQINPSTRLDVNLTFVSSDFFSNNSINYNDILNQTITSNANFSKVWDQSGLSLAVNYSRTQYLSNGNVFESLPNINLSKTTTYPFKSQNGSTEGKQKWYELIGYSYSGQLTNNRNQVDGDVTTKAGAMHNIAISASPKVGYFNVSPSVNYKERWYNRWIKQELVQYEVINNGVAEKRDSIKKTTINELNSVRTFDLSVSASTKLYGIFNPNILGVESFRHTLMPSISYSYSPDFSTDGWGYYGTYSDSKGNMVRYDKFSEEVFSGVGNSRSQALNFSLNNVFEMKLSKAPGDTTKEQTKIQLLNLGASVSYNFEAENYKLSDLNLNYRTQIGEWLSFSGNSTYTFYDTDFIAVQDMLQETRVDRYLVSNGKGLMRLTNFGFSVSTTLSGERIKGDQKPEADNNKVDNATLANSRRNNIGNSIYEENQSPDLSIPWNLSMSYNYNLSKALPSMETSYSNLNIDLGFSVSKNWKFTIRGSYDFNEKQITAPQITIYRDLHCWEMNFSWNPLGTYSGYRFEIRMKSPELKDIKVEKSGGLYSGRR